MSANMDDSLVCLKSNLLFEVFVGFVFGSSHSLMSLV